ncbi:hypothetical protein GGR56DRAFT_624275 [Xylariaceae sp. FL0804]|nr:hypothetical protein GGR56DRAFT_624275 [Xylariaceae sp. FL0804]
MEPTTPVTPVTRVTRVTRDTLSGPERERRDAVIAAAEKRREGEGQKLIALYNNDIPAESANKNLAICSLPLLSADHQHWHEDRIAWRLIFGKDEGFHWAEPKQYGAPYSRPFLEAFFDKHKTENEKDAARKQNAEKAKEWDDKMKSVPGPAEQAAGTVFVHPPLGKDQEIVPLEEATRVWKRLYGDQAWVARSRPFEVPVPKNVSRRVVMQWPGPEEDRDRGVYTLRRLVNTSSGLPLFQVYYRFQDNVGPGKRDAWVTLSWLPGKADTVMAGYMLKTINGALLRWYYELLIGNAPALPDFLASTLEAGLTSPEATLENIQRRTLAQHLLQVARERDAEQIEGDKARNQELLAKVDDFCSDVATRKITSHVNRAKDAEGRAKVLALISKAIDGGWEPLPLSREQLRIIARGPCSKLLVAEVQGILMRDNYGFRKKLDDLGQILTGKDNGWETVLPPGIRYALIHTELKKYVAREDVGKEPKTLTSHRLEAWSVLKDQLEFQVDEK